jgi:hypothetical protein
MGTECIGTTGSTGYDGYDGYDRYDRDKEYADAGHLFESHLFERR